VVAANEIMDGALRSSDAVESPPAAKSDTG
jgi:hypothetical protein